MIDAEELKALVADNSLFSKFTPEQLESLVTIFVRRDRRRAERRRRRAGVMGDVAAAAPGST